MISQLEFPQITAQFPVGTKSLIVKKKHQIENPDPVHLASALTAENISFLSFALIMALFRHKAPMSINSLARAVGFSYWATRSQVVNTHYFRFGTPNPLVTAELTQDAHTVLVRIEKRLAPKPKPTPAKP